MVDDMEGEWWMIGGGVVDDMEGVVDGTQSSM